MPEGPEVLGYYNFIKSFFDKQTLTNLNILSGKYSKKDLPNLDIFKSNLPCKIKEVLIKGKTIFIYLENKFSIVITHGMTGYWSDDMEKHSRIKFECEDSDDLFYVDSRNFGSITICLTEEEYYFRQDKLGPYVLNDNITYDDFYSRLDKKPKSKIAVALLDQNLLSGIGNYLRCDILWYAKIYGETRIEDLTLKQRKRLFDASINLCRYYAELSYSLEFTPYDYDREFFIYMQDDDIYGNSVITKKLNNRTFHFVEN
jgi:endonuclease-8